MCCGALLVDQPEWGNSLACLRVCDGDPLLSQTGVPIRGGSARLSLVVISWRRLAAVGIGCHQLTTRTSCQALCPPVNWFPPQYLCQSMGQADKRTTCPAGLSGCPSACANCGQP